MMQRALVIVPALLFGTGSYASEPWVEPVTGMSFVAVPKGCFQMGTDERAKPTGSDAWRFQNYRGSLNDDEGPRHRVCVGQFWLARHEVRATDWIRVMGTAPPVGVGNEPAGGISWVQAQAFVTKMNELSGGQYHFRLPTEAEWEFACLAERKKDASPGIYGDGVLNAQARYLAADTLLRTSRAGEVGTLNSNALGIYDLLGNVWEWVEDHYQTDGYKQHALFDPVVRTGRDARRVIRGGSYRSEYPHMRCANRSHYDSNDALPQIGMRLARAVVRKEAE
jgi:formylglycine-generating enzyme required for sulfatase activity